MVTHFYALDLTACVTDFFSQIDIIRKSGVLSRPDMVGGALNMRDWHAQFGRAVRQVRQFKFLRFQLLSRYVLIPNRRFNLWDV